MIRQLGNPTWFCSFSAAETRWIHLIKILGRLIDNKDYTDDKIRQMSWQKKSELIQKDSVTCARNFEHMVQLLIHDFIKSSCHSISLSYYGQNPPFLGYCLSSLKSFRQLKQCE